MIIVNDVLNTHLPTKMKEQIDAQFPTNPEALLDGVNYSYQEKTWNFRIAIVTDDTSKVEAVYVRINAPDDLYSCWFDYAGKKIHEGREIECLTYVTLRGSKSGLTGAGPHKIDKKIENDTIKPFLDLLRNGQKDENSTAPKINYFLEKRTTFFKKCPQLIPEKTILARIMNSNKSVFLIALIASSCILSVVSYINGKWYPQPKPPVTPPNIPTTPTRALS